MQAGPCLSVAADPHDVLNSIAEGGKRSEGVSAQKRALVGQEASNRYKGRPMHRHAYSFILQ